MSEVRPLAKIAEQPYQLHLPGVIRYPGNIKQLTESIVRHTIEMTERTVGAEGQVQIIQHKTEFSVFLPRTPALAVILRPVRIAQIKLHSHIVTKLIHIYPVQDSTVCVIIRRRSAQLQQFLPGIPCSAHLHIATVTVNLEHIYLIGREPMISIYIVLIVRFTHVNGSHKPTVDIMSYGPVVLQVHVNSACTYQ